MPKVSIYEEMFNPPSLLWQVLDEDIRDLEKLSLQLKPQTWYRLYIRFIGMYIEAIINNLQSHMRVDDFFNANKPKYPQDFSLRDFDKKSKEKKTIKKEGSFLDYFIKTINSYISLNKPGLKINEKSKILKAISDLIQVRNRITHPYLLEDLSVSSKEYENSKETFYDFLEILSYIQDMKNIASLKGKQADFLKKREN